MNYLLLLACVLGAAAAAAYAATVLLVSERGRLAQERPLLLRSLPGMAAAVFSLGLALPAFVRHEPADTRAWPGATALALGAAGLLLLAVSVARGLPAWWATVRLVREWGRHSQPVTLAGTPAPARVLQHPFPVVALVGIVKPRLFMASQVVEALSPVELQAVLAHEAGHLEARDNLKRLLLRFLPTLGWRRVAARLEERWEAAAEAAADRRTGPDAALDLASALLKVARLAPPGARLGASVAAFHSGDGVAGRVQALLQSPPPPPPRSTTRTRIGALLLGAGVALAAAGLLPVIHHLNEVVVHLP